jgi:16S rRNA (guanine966-N2)-methyltransferase
VVFVDPPFRKGLLEETLSLLENNGWLADDALIYVESEVENGLPPVPVYWDLHREKVAGQVAYRLYHRQYKEDPMPVLINLGRLLMLGVWAFRS